MQLRPVLVSVSPGAHPVSAQTVLGMNNCRSARNGYPKWVKPGGKCLLPPRERAGLGNKQHWPTSPARSSREKLEGAVFPAVSDGKQEFPGFSGKQRLRQ